MSGALELLLPHSLEKKMLESKPLNTAIIVVVFLPNWESHSLEMLMFVFHYTTLKRVFNCPLFVQKMTWRRKLRRQAFTFQQTLNDVISLFEHLDLLENHWHPDMALVVFEAPANALETHLLGSKWRKEKSLLKCVARPSGCSSCEWIFRTSFGAYANLWRFLPWLNTIIAVTEPPSQEPSYKRLQVMQEGSDEYGEVW